MNADKYVFSQVTERVPHYVFQRIVNRYKGDYKTRDFTCWDQFLCMMFAQLTYRDSLRDIEVCLRSRATNLYHMGIRGRISKSTLADANENRDCRIYVEMAQYLIEKARSLYADDPIGVAEVNETVYAIDSTTIDLCLELFPWARFRRRKAAIKLHTLMDLRGSIPTLIYLSDGKVHDVNFLDRIFPEAGAIYVMDRGYVDFARLYRFTLEHAFFVTRGKSNMVYKVVESRPIVPGSGVRSDQIIVLEGTTSSKDYPERLRRIRFHDVETNKTLVFITNNMLLQAEVIAKLYKCRWHIELFFKWIKQNLKIKTFYGYSQNAVRTQIAIAVCAYVTIAILKKECNIAQSTGTMMQILSVSVFEKVSLAQLFADYEISDGITNMNNQHCNQLMFNGL
jgi:hypothetical protein